MSSKRHRLKVALLRNFVASLCRQPLSISGLCGRTQQRLATKVADKVGVAAICLLLGCPACRREMYDQPHSKPLKKSDFFGDKMASRPVVPNTVARGHLNADDALFAGKIGTNLVETFPIPVTREVLQRGQQRYDIYCSPCHARTGEGNGMIVQRGFPPPP